MKITNIDEIMARSLRSLAGFCMGECGEFSPEGTLYTLLYYSNTSTNHSHYGKFYDIIMTLYLSIPLKWLKNY